MSRSSEMAWSPAALAAWNCQLTTVGRKSGLPRTVTLWFVPDGQRVFLAGGAANPQWCRNLRANGAVEIRIGSEVRRGQAHLVSDPAEAIAVRDRFPARYVLARLGRPFGAYTKSVAVVVDLDG